NQWHLAANFDLLFRMGYVEFEIDLLLLAQTRSDIVILLRLETLRFNLHRVGAGRKLRKIEPSLLIRLSAALQARFATGDLDRSTWNRRIRCIRHLSDNRSCGFPLFLRSCRCHSKFTDQKTK